MTNSKAAPAARISAANALLDRGYGKPPQHITGEQGSFVQYFARVPEKLSNEEWQKKWGDSGNSASEFCCLAADVSTSP
jgi:hypothetical protein